MKTREKKKMRRNTIEAASNEKFKRTPIERRRREKSDRLFSSDQFLATFHNFRCSRWRGLFTFCLHWIYCDFYFLININSFRARVVSSILFFLFSTSTWVKMSTLPQTLRFTTQLTYGVSLAWEFGGIRCQTTQATHDHFVSTRQLVRLLFQIHTYFS